MIEGLMRDNLMHALARACDDMWVNGRRSRREVISMEFPFGHTVRHLTTGFEGICTGAAAYMDGTTRVQVEAKDATGRPILEWYNVGEVEFC
jgi:hypothetical protein